MSIVYSFYLIKNLLRLRFTYIKKLTHKIKRLFFLSFNFKLIKFKNITLQLSKFCKAFLS